MRDGCQPGCSTEQALRRSHHGRIVEPEPSSRRRLLLLSGDALRALEQALGKN